MSAGTTVEFTAALDADPEVDKRTDLNLRFLHAGLADTTILEGIPRGVVLFLLPDDDPEFVAQEVLAAADSARRGADVYLRHVRVADLPELPESTVRIGEEPGTQRATYDPETGEILTNQILGEDGEWRDTDEPFPIPRDDGDDPFYRF